MTKTSLLTLGGGGNHIADFHLIIRDDHAVNHSLDQRPFLFNVAMLSPCHSGEFLRVFAIIIFDKCSIKSGNDVDLEHSKFFILRT